MFQRLFLLVTVSFALVLQSGCQQSRQAFEKVKSIFVKVDASKGDADSKNNASGQMVEVKVTDLVDGTEMRGKFEAAERADIRSDKRIKIGPAQVKRYDLVKRGQVLFEVDTRELVQKKIEAKERLEQLRLDLSSARSQEKFAKRNYDRKTKLARKGLVPERELDEATKQMTDASNQAKTKELELRKATRDYEQASQMVTGASFVSPLNGIVQTVHPGAAEINPGDSIATIVDPAKLAAFVGADEATASRLSKGAKVSVVPDTATGERLLGEVQSTAMLPSNGSIMSQYEIKISMKDVDIERLKLMAGFDATVYAEFARREKVMTVPLAAIRMNGADSYSVVSNSKSSSGSLKAVKLGLRTKLEVEVVAGIKPGQFVDISARDQSLQ